MTTPQFSRGMSRHRQIKPPGRVLIAQNEIERAGDKNIGGPRQGAHHILGRPDTAEVGERDEKRHVLLGAPQKAHGVRLVSAPDQSFAKIGEAIRKACLRHARQEAREPRRLGGRELPEIRRMIGNAFEERCNGGRVRQSCDGGAARDKAPPAVLPRQRDRSTAGAFTSRS